MVDVQQKGAPPSGPHPVVVEHDQGLATHTVYRPIDLGPGKHSLLVWGEGGCAKNGLTFPEFLSEIASHGFIVVADGPPIPPSRNGRGGEVGSKSGQTVISPDGSALIAAINWMEREAADPSSRFYQNVDTARVAAMGMSCGGLMAYSAAADPRVAAIGIWNSGLQQPDGRIFLGLHSPVLIVTGGVSDIAYANGKRDFDTMPAHVPVFHGVYPSVAHGGTYNEDNGGAFGVAAVAWLKWHLRNDIGSKAKGLFVGPLCGLCASSQWQVNSRSLR